MPSLLRMHYGSKDYVQYYFYYNILMPRSQYRFGARTACKIDIFYHFGHFRKVPGRVPYDPTGTGVFLQIARAPRLLLSCSRFSRRFYQIGRRSTALGKPVESLKGTDRPPIGGRVGSARFSVNSCNKPGGCRAGATCTARTSGGTRSWSARRLTDSHWVPCGLSHKFFQIILYTYF